jgi:hypothetical protein
MHEVRDVNADAVRIDRALQEIVSDEMFGREEKETVYKLITESLHSIDVYVTNTNKSIATTLVYLWFVSC